MIIFAWSGFPQYAARCVGAFVKSTNEEVVVVATRPKVPVKGMEVLSNCRVFWVDHQDDDCSVIEKINKDTILIISGWAIKPFNVLRNRVLSVGGRVYVMNDANYLSYHMRSVLSLKNWVALFLQWARGIQYRKKFRNLFSGYFVPGRSGHILARCYGVPESRIVEGMYAADPSLFYSDRDLIERDKKIICVGRFCGTKNVINVCRAFGASGIAKEGWRLEFYGSGLLKKRLEKEADLVNNKLGRVAVLVNDFVQPENLGALYRSARVFVLASKKEHWGVVVHEAALSGCYLMLSTIIGAAMDFMGDGNGEFFNPWSVSSIVRAFKKLPHITEYAWSNAYAISRERALTHSPEIFADRAHKLIKLI